MIPRAGGTLAGHGVRDGQAMITILRYRLIRVPVRLVRHAGVLGLCLSSGHHLLDEILAWTRALPVMLWPGHLGLEHTGTRHPEAILGSSACHRLPNHS